MARDGEPKLYMGELLVVVFFVGRYREFQGRLPANNESPGGTQEAAPNFINGCAPLWNHEYSRQGKRRGGEIAGREDWLGCFAGDRRTETPHNLARFLFRPNIYLSLSRFAQAPISFFKNIETNMAWALLLIRKMIDENLASFETTPEAIDRYDKLMDETSKGTAFGVDCPNSYYKVRLRVAFVRVLSWLGTDFSALHGLPFKKLASKKVLSGRRDLQMSRLLPRTLGPHGTSLQLTRRRRL